VTLTCSIIISCYNKADYIAEAVESALDQSHSATEVIVVDDGSCDASPDVLRAFEGRATVITKPNGGQASALNAGFARSTGDIVIFLDGDDLLMPDVVERVMAAWRPNYSKIHFPLQKITAAGAVLAGAVLPPHKELPHGDLAPLVRRFGLYPSPPMSGNAFSRGFLRHVMPLHEPPYAGFADTPLIGLAGLLGEIGALATPGGFYRVVEDGVSHLDLTRLEHKVEADERYVELLAGHLGRAAPAIRARWPQHVKDRLVIRKFAGRSIPPGASLVSLVGDYWRAVGSWPEYHVRTRLKFSLWAMLVLCLPADLLRRVPGIAGPNIEL
jgi:glycosyltransferase involved in cell wall biosynthesis